MVAGSYFLKPLVNNYILPGDFSGMSSDCFHATKDIPYTTFDLVIILQ